MEDWNDGTGAGPWTMDDELKEKWKNGKLESLQIRGF